MPGEKLDSHQGTWTGCILTDYIKHALKDAIFPEELKYKFDRL